MPLYYYKAIDSRGKTTSGSSDAQNVGILKETLKDRGLFLMESRQEQAPPSPSIAGVVTLLKGGGPPKIPPVLKKIIPLPADPKAKAPLNRIALFSTELAVMTRISLPI